MKTHTRRMWRPVAAAAALALVAAACGGDNGGTAEGPTQDDLTDEGSFTILHAFTGDEDTAGLQAIIAAFNEDFPNIQVSEEGSNDFESLARTRVGAGNAPDIMLHPQPGLLEDFWNQGVVLPLDGLFDPADFDGELVDGLIDLANFDGSTYAFPMRLSLKSLVWYNPQTFEANGYSVPETWDEMMDLSQQMVDDGIAPWCIGIESGDATGWVATDWVEDILLRTIGPDAYDDWVAGELAFNSDEVRGAIEEYMVPIWTNDDFVFGGQQQIARENFGTSVTGILGDDPECGLHRQATFIEGFIEENSPDAEFGTDYDFFYLPAIDESIGNPTMGGGDFAALYTDNGAAATFIDWLTNPEAGEAWAARGGFLSPFAPVFDGDIYPTDSSRVASEILADSDFFRFDGSDAMPGDVGASSQSGSFWIEMTNWITGAQDLETALSNIDALYDSL